MPVGGLWKVDPSDIELGLDWGLRKDDLFHRRAEAAGGGRERILVNDERFTQAASLFHQASSLLADLTALGKRLPESDFSARRPSDWTDARSYANCVELLRVNLDTTLRRVLTDLRVRDEWEVIRALLPPHHQFSRSGLAWLASFDNPPGGKTEPDR